MSATARTEDTKLSSLVTVAMYREYDADEDRSAIASFVRQRFAERYITPLLKIPPTARNGFCMMAVSCLLIETLESFWQGWSNTDRRSGDAFRKFFTRCEAQNNELRAFAKDPDDFYCGVRCGILHQAETTRGWRIRRKGALYDSATKTINATKFHEELAGCLDHYCNTLESSDWDSDVWKHCRDKMRAVIEHCDQT